MTPSDPHQLRRIDRNVQFLAYRAGAPNPIAKSIFLVLLAPLALIVVFGFCFEAAIQFGLVKPARKSGPVIEEPWKPRLHGHLQGEHR